MTQGSFDPYGPKAPTNAAEFTVSELSGALKRTVEEAYGSVRVRGEISGFKRAGSGHLYMALKDESAVLDAVCWRGAANRLAVAPEDGLEVIASGRLTTYPGRSKYQLVIEQMEPAGEGALLKLLEDRRKKLAAEGLFAEERKRPIPYLPDVIGIVTSPTGAVIRDILHRLADRFPRRVLLWPVLVQGDGAAEQVARAVRGFNDLLPTDNVPRPDVLIVARGGGSLEDLWSFNEEIVVRAVAESTIPVITAVGHETDTTLIDYASDLRAPTPTGAAEKAVPVRTELAARLDEISARLTNGVSRLTQDRARRLEDLSRPLNDPGRVLEEKRQRLDAWGERLPGATRQLVSAARSRLAELSHALPSPQQQVAEKRAVLDKLGVAAETAVSRRSAAARAAFDRTAAGLRPQALTKDVTAGRNGLEGLAQRLSAALSRQTTDKKATLDGLERLLETTSYRSILARGFAVVRAGDGAAVQSVSQLPNGTGFTLELADGAVDAVATGGGMSPEKPKKRPRPSKGGDERQGSLL